MIKSGFIPFFENRMLFAKSSNPNFGGPLFGIAKGHQDPIDLGCSYRTAVREAQEEIGLKVSNIKASQLLGVFDQGTYDLHVWVGQIINRDDFDPFGWEVSEVQWMNYNEFCKMGRLDQQYIVKAAQDIIQ